MEGGKSGMLSVREYLTHPQTLSFWKRYFFNENITTVTVDNFFQAILQEYFLALIEPKVKSNEIEINIEELKSDLFQALQSKISVNQQTVSLNALQLFTREFGLDPSLQGMIIDCINK